MVKAAVMQKRTLQDMFEKVNGIKLTEGWFGQGNKTPAPMQGTQLKTAPVFNYQQKYQEVMKGLNKMAKQYIRYFVADVTGDNHVWSNDFDSWIAIAVKKVLANPAQFAQILHKYPQVEDAVKMVTAADQVNPPAVAENVEGTPATKEHALGYLSDLYKDVYGTRPNLSRYRSMSDAEVWQEIQNLEKQAGEEADQEAVYDQQNLAKFEALIQKTIEHGAGDRETALRWLYDSDDDQYDASYFLYKHHVNTHSPEGRKLQQELDNAILKK